MLTAVATGSESAAAWQQLVCSPAQELKMLMRAVMLCHMRLRAGGPRCDPDFPPWRSLNLPCEISEALCPALQPRMAPTASMSSLQARTAPQMAVALALLLLLHTCHASAAPEVSLGRAGRAGRQSSLPEQLSWP